MDYLIWWAQNIISLFIWLQPEIFFSLSKFQEKKKEEKKEWESPEHAAIREAKLKAFQEMQELNNPANQGFKAVRIQDMVTMSY